MSASSVQASLWASTSLTTGSFLRAKLRTRLLLLAPLPSLPAPPLQVSDLHPGPKLCPPAPAPISQLPRLAFPPTHLSYCSSWLSICFLENLDGPSRTQTGTGRNWELSTRVQSEESVLRQSAYEDGVRGFPSAPPDIHLLLAMWVPVYFFTLFQVTSTD